MSFVPIADDEDLSDLTSSGYRLLQKKNGFRFSLDAVLLAHFVCEKNNAQIIDLGCGSGVLPVLLYAYNSSFRLTAVEIQEKYAALARRNMLLNDIPCEVVNADLRQLPKEWGSQFDAVVANPPFYPLYTGKLNAAEEINIARHEICCTLDDVLRSAKRLLKPRGSLYMIYRPERLDELLSLCRQYELKPHRLRFIHPDSHTAANLLLLEAVKGGRHTPTILPPLIVYQAQGRYSQEIIQIYGGKA